MKITERFFNVLDFAETNLIVIGLLGAIGFPLYFFIWQYLTKKKIIETNGETAHLYNATCLVFLDEIRHSKGQPSIDVEVFFNLFKDRFIKHKEELNLHNSTGCEPKFLFDCILTKAQKQHEYYVMYSSPSSRINEYRTHINNLIDELKKL